MPIVDQIANALGGDIAGGIARIISLFKVDPNLALQKQVEVEEIKLQMVRDAADAASREVQGQLNVNAAEAANTNLFVSGWRPFIGWVCGLGLATQFMVNPLVTWIAALAGKPVAFPSLDLGTLLTLLFGMLGLGAMRSYEKVQGASGTSSLQ